MITDTYISTIGLVEVDIVELAAQHDGVGGGDDDVGERQRRDQQGSAESVDALDDELRQRLDDL